MIKAVKIEIGFSEHPAIQQFGAPTFTCMRSANEYFAHENRMVEYAKALNQMMGYYKTDFTITFEDGTQYKGRYDFGSDAVDLTTHIRRFAECYSGRIKPSHMKPEHWEHFKRDMVSAESQAYFAGILDNYDLDN